MASLDDNWQVVLLTEIKEPGKVTNSEQTRMARELELLKKIDLKKIFRTDGCCLKRNKVEFNA